MFSKLSDEMKERRTVEIDLPFFTDYMPYAQGSYVKVYLYGLASASLSAAEGNDIETMSRRLDMPVSAIVEAYTYWEELGLVIFRHTDPPSVEYLPVLPEYKRIKKFSKDKYKPFNDQLAAMLPSRNVLPNEYNEYYNAMESLHISVEAMLTIIAYCLRLKGEKVSSQYIIAVARNLAADGVTGFEKVSERLNDYELFGKAVTVIFKPLGMTRKPEPSDVRLYRKWTKEFGYDEATVVAVAKSLKRGSPDKLDAALTRYRELGLMTKEEIAEYEKDRERLLNLTKRINDIIGVYYYQLDHTIDTYVGKWLALGFSDETLITLADYCYKRNIHTLEGMNDAVNGFYKKGLVSAEAISGFISDAIRTDAEIKRILEIAGLTRGVITRDRDCYRTWVANWKMSDALIEKAAELARGSGSPVSYMNGILASWHEKGVTDASDAEAVKVTESVPKKDAGASGGGRVKESYTAEELNAIFDALNAEDL